MFLRCLSLVTLVLFILGLAAPAHAATQYVRSNGTDTASCTRTAPCASLVAALSNAQPTDTIICMDSIVVVQGLIITKSVDIECSSARLVLRDAFVNGSASIQINIPVSSADPLRSVRLRGISITGASAFFASGKVIPVGI